MNRALHVTTGELAKELGATLVGAEDLHIYNAARIEEAQTGDICFLSDLKYEKYLYQSRPSAVLVTNGFEPKRPIDAAIIRVHDMNVAKAKLMYLLSDQSENDTYEISNTALLSKESLIESKVAIGHYSIIGRKSKVGTNTRIHDQVWIDEQVEIGIKCVIHSGVKIYKGTKIGNHVTIHANAVIGSDGFGFLPDENGKFQKIAQLGNVIIEDHVDIGANTVIDRASLGNTIIESGVKLDNLIQVAHNVHIKKNTVIAAQAGIAGSTVIGERCMIGGQAGLVGHINIANGTHIQAQSGVAGNVKKENSKLYGTPALDYNNYLKSYAIFKSLPSIKKLLNKISRYLSDA